MGHLHVLGANAECDSQILFVFNWTCTGTQQQRTHFAVVDCTTRCIVFLPKLLSIEAQGAWISQNHRKPQDLDIEKMGLCWGESELATTARAPLSYEATQSWVTLIEEHRRWLLDQFQQSTPELRFAHIEDSAQRTYALCTSQDEEGGGTTSNVYTLAATIMVKGPTRPMREWRQRKQDEEAMMMQSPAMCCGTIAIAPKTALGENLIDMCEKITPGEFQQYLEARRVVIGTGSLARYREFLRSLKGKYTFSYELYVAPIDEEKKPATIDV